MNKSCPLPVSEEWEGTGKPVLPAGNGGAGDAGSGRRESDGVYAAVGRHPVTAGGRNITGRLLKRNRAKEAVTSLRQLSLRGDTYDGFE